MKEYERMKELEYEHMHMKAFERERQLFSSDISQGRKLKGIIGDDWEVLDVPFGKPIKETIVEGFSDSDSDEDEYDEEGEKVE